MAGRIQHKRKEFQKGINRRNPNLSSHRVLYKVTQKRQKHSLSVSIDTDWSEQDEIFQSKSNSFTTQIAELSNSI